MVPLPPPLIVLQPHPIFNVHVSALVAPEQLGMTSACGVSVMLCALPMTLLAPMIA